MAHSQPVGQTPRGLYVQLACIWEATARKPGNVHRYVDFEDVSYVDFLVSAAAIAPVMDTALDRSVGETVLESVKRTRQVTDTNTNLGIILLLAPLAAIPDGEELGVGIERVLDVLTIEDSKQVYEAIRIAQPGGLGEVEDQDVREVPTLPLREIMAMAADRDSIAKQYVEAFGPMIAATRAVFDRGIERGEPLERSIIELYLWYLSHHRDTLVERKCGEVQAKEIQRQALEVQRESEPTVRERKFQELDVYLRADGNRRNPGTTADLVAGSLYLALREGIITPLCRW
ncbi:MAG: triphosphoribosyl-dephospho-CoA synthase [Gemmataceae bacterium]